ncbi:hypothetical protein, partial [Longimicrobium sp.]|uniref:hypothetical protein n=1 Tax=Longimicrobium sp. TaxID=2029185 RepID=UPI002F9478F7
MRICRTMFVPVGARRVDARWSGSMLTCSQRSKPPYWLSPSLPHPLPIPAMILETAALVALVSVPAAA